MWDTAGGVSRLMWEGRISGSGWRPNRRPRAESTKGGGVAVLLLVLECSTSTEL